jgi:hypothetical protein
MNSTVELLWWIAIAIALALTFLAAARLMRVVRLCGQIRTLARAAVPPAQGIAQHTAAVANLGSVVALAPTLLSVCGDIDGAAGTIATTLESVAPREA